MYAKKKYKETDYKCQNARAEIKEKKNEFRKRKRLNEKLIKDNNFVKLKNIFKKDKTSFWKEVKKIQKKKINIGVEIKDLKNEFYNQFNRKIFMNQETTRIANVGYKEFIDKNNNMIYKDYVLNLDQLNKLQLLKLISVF